MSDKLIVLSEKQFRTIIEKLDGIRSDLMGLDDFPTTDRVKTLLNRNQEDTVSQMKEEVVDLMTPLKKIVDAAVSPKRKNLLSRAKEKIDSFVKRKGKEIDKSKRG